MQTTRETTRHLAWWEPLALAVALGTCAGWVQWLVVAYRQHVRHEFTWTSRDLVWMSPLGNVAILCVPAVGVALLCVVRRRWMSRAVGTALVSVVAMVSVLLNIAGLHPYAVALLGAGLGAQIGRMAARSDVRARRWTWRAAALGTLASAAGFAFSDSQGGPAGVAPRTDSPNVLIIILDTVRAASTSLHGYARSTTPALTRLAREGVWFDWAIAPSAWTLPSHASMFTGRAASTLSTSWRRPLDAAFPTVAEALSRAGYATGAFVGNLYYTHYESGLGRGFQVHRDFRRSRLQVLWSTTLGHTPLLDRLLWGRHSPNEILRTLQAFELRSAAGRGQVRPLGAEVVTEFLDWQQQVQGRPFFAFVNLYDAHEPYEPPTNYRTIFAPVPGEQDLYDSGIRYADDQVARIVDALRRRHALDNTLLIVTADHGEQWGEHGLHNHGNSLYLPLVHIPLVIRFPSRVRPGDRVREPTGLARLAATILDATQVPGPGIPGVSLFTPGLQAPVVTETEGLNPASSAGSPADRGSLASIVRDSLQFIRNGDSTYQLFNVVRDAAQARDLVNTPEGCAIAVALDSILRTVSRVPATPAFAQSRCAARARTGGSTTP